MASDAEIRIVSRIHRAEISEFHDSIICSLTACSQPLTVPNNRGTKQAIVPGWNEYVKEHHDAAMDAYWLWREMGKPRNGDVFTLMKLCRSRFKYALRKCDGCVRTWAKIYRVTSFDRKENKAMWRRRIPHCVACMNLPTLDGDVESVYRALLMEAAIAARKCGGECLHGVSTSDTAPLLSLTDLLDPDMSGSLTGRFISSLERHGGDSTILRKMYLGVEDKKSRYNFARQ